MPRKICSHLTLHKEAQHKHQGCTMDLFLTSSGLWSNYANWCESHWSCLNLKGLISGMNQQLSIGATWWGRDYYQSCVHRNKWTGGMSSNMCSIFFWWACQSSCSTTAIYCCWGNIDNTQCCFGLHFLFCLWIVNCCLEIQKIDKYSIKRRQLDLWLSNCQVIGLLQAKFMMRKFSDDNQFDRSTFHKCQNYQELLQTKLFKSSWDGIPALLHLEQRQQLHVHAEPSLHLLPLQPFLYPLQSPTLLTYALCHQTYWCYR